MGGRRRVITFTVQDPVFSYIYEEDDLEEYYEIADMDSPALLEDARQQFVYDMDDYGSRASGVLGDEIVIVTDVVEAQAADDDADLHDDSEMEEGSLGDAEERYAARQVIDLLEKGYVPVQGDSDPKSGHGKERA